MMGSLFLYEKGLTGRVLHDISVLGYIVHLMKGGGI